MGVEIRGLDSLKRKLNAMPKVLENALWDATFEIVEVVQGKAESKLQSSMKHSTGGLAGSLKHEVVVDSNGNVVGRVWSDVPHSLYREMGTGKVGEASPKDLPEGVTPVYTQTPWFIPASEVGGDLNALYGMPKITIQGQIFYKTNGQPARPFLYPALKEGTKDSEGIYKEYVRKGLRGGLK